MNQMELAGDRLREERLRLDLSQAAFGEVGGVTKKTQMLYESGARFPDAQYMAAIHAAGADVLYILVGSRDASLPALDAPERLLVDNFRRCAPAAKAHLIQTSSLLASGLDAINEDEKPARKKTVQTNTGHGAILVGRAGKSVVIGRASGPSQRSRERG